MQNQKSKADEIKGLQELEVFAKTTAGIEIIESLNMEIKEMMFKFVAGLNDPNLNKYIALSCELKEKLELVRKFTQAGDIREVIENSPDEE